MISRIQNPDVLESIYKITGKHVKFYEFNVLDEEKTDLYLRKINWMR